MAFPLFKKSMPDTIRKEALFALTPLGVQKAEAFALDGPKADLLYTLKEQGSMSIQELSEATGMNANKVRHLLKYLARQQYIKHVGG